MHPYSCSTIPCHVSAGRGDKTVVISPYDPTFYTDMGFSPKKPVRVQGGGRFMVKLTTGRSKERTIYYGQVKPFEVRLRFRKRS